MERGGEFVQAYNGQIAVDGESQIIVAHGLSNQAPDTPQQEMRAKVASPEGQEIYRRRKCIVEPVFGQIKQAMGFTLRATQPGKRSGWRQSPQPCQRPERARARSWAGEERRALRATGS